MVLRPAFAGRRWSRLTESNRGQPHHESAAPLPEASRGHGRCRTGADARGCGWTAATGHHNGTVRQDVASRVRTAAPRLRASILLGFLGLRLVCKLVGVNDRRYAHVRHGESDQAAFWSADQSLVQQAVPLHRAVRLPPSGLRGHIGGGHSAVAEGGHRVHVAPLSRGRAVIARAEERPSELVFRARRRGGCINISDRLSAAASH